MQHGIGTVGCWNVVTYQDKIKIKVNEAIKRNDYTFHGVYKDLSLVLGVDRQVRP